MTDYTKLVESLRHCVDPDTTCDGCPRSGNNGLCADMLYSDAADAIEELTGFLAEAERDRDEYEERMEKEQDRVLALQAKTERLTKENRELYLDRPELEEVGGKWVWKLPKRGKWIGVSPMVDTVQCSVCGGQLFSAELETPYCPYWSGLGCMDGQLMEDAADAIEELIKNLDMASQELSWTISYAMHLMRDIDELHDMVKEGKDE